jgi:glycerol-3-phosphate acyltransferase PlsY
VLIGWLGRGVDIRGVGDRNPGTFNVFLAAGTGWGVLALVLEFAKGALPVGLAGLAGVRGWESAPVALAALLGHAYSPWLGGRGGKALAVTFGVWTGLTLASGPLALGALCAVNYRLWSSSAWATLLAFTAFGGCVLALAALTGRPEWLAVWLGNWALLAWKHRHDLRTRPRRRRRAAVSAGVEAPAPK